MHFDPPFRPESPSDPAFALRSGVRCAAAPMAHPPVVVTAKSVNGLDRQERLFRCAVPGCASPAWGEMRPHRHPARQSRRPFEE